MNIGLINIEPRVFNTAYMQIASYHKQRGDTVDWWSPLEDRQFDHIYCSSLFDYTDKNEIPKRAICGGTGFDVTSLLSKAIEACELDYSIYPNCRKSYIWFSRGCIRDCPWCIVRQKEGGIHSVSPKNLNPRGEYIVVCDNNFFASPQWPWAVQQLETWGLPVDMQGIDIRLLDSRKAAALRQLRHRKQIKIAWDDPKDQETFEAIERLLFFDWIPRWQLMCYVLIGFNSTEGEDLARVEILRELGIDPFVMPYNKNDLYQKAFARWVNHKAIFKKVKWRDYKGRVYAQEQAGHGWN